MLIRWLYLVPFSYFWSTRLRHGSVGFHLLFEWVAALVLVGALCDLTSPSPILRAVLAYVSFICVYEIGYFQNDLIAARKEPGGRLRGPQGVHWQWPMAWVAVRLVVFLTIGYTLGQLHSWGWWSFYGALLAVFFLHNTISDSEIKAGSFLWLSWFRFMAPVFIVVPSNYLLGIAFACAMSYSAFRQFGYLDGKGLLAMPGRKRAIVRWTFFVWPLFAAVVVLPLPDAKGYVVLVTYYALVASIGVLVSVYRSSASKDGG